MPVIVSTSPGFGKHGRVTKKLEELGWEVIRCIDTNLPDGGVSNYIKHADFLVVGLIPVTAETLADAEQLKGVLKHGVGTDNIDIPACSNLGIPVMNTPGANADAVAELSIASMFSLARNIVSGHNSVTSGGWERKVGSQLGEKTLGIVGLGNIGRSLALKARGLGMNVLATDLYPDTDFATANNIELTDLDDLLKRSDYVSLHVFGGEGSSSLIDANKLALMKPSACLLNLARGEVIDLDALASALKNNQLGGAAIDAYVSEPPDTSHPIFAQDNVIFTPHTGADTLEALENMGLMNIADMQTLLAGDQPSRILNKEALNTNE